MTTGTTGGAEEAAGARSERALETVSGPLSRGWLLALWTIVLVGAAGFVLALFAEPQRLWESTWANFLFWTALAQAGVIFGAALHTAKGHWGKGFRRLAEATGAFLPVSFLLFWLLYFGADHIFPWLGPVEEHINREWLTLDGVFLRNGAGLLILYVLSFAFLRLSLRPDAPLVAGRHQDGWRRWLVERIGRNWRGDRAELERSRAGLSRLSPALILVWVAVFTLLSVDLIMSLMPGFLSVIWGASYFVGGWLAMLALVAIAANVQRRRHDLSAAWGRWQYHDLGKMLFAFVIFWSYLWWSQYFVIWYGNLSHETVFFEQRTDGTYGPWYTLQMILVFVVPFVLLLWRKPKMNPTYLAGVSAVILVGFWLERYLLVVPSTSPAGPMPLGWVEAAVSLGFLGLFGLCYALFVSTFPVLPIRETLIGEPGRGP